MLFGNNTVPGILPNDDNFFITNGVTSAKYVCDATKDYEKEKKEFRDKMRFNIDLRKQALI